MVHFFCLIFPNDLCRITNGYAIGWNIFRHHTTRTDDTTVADGDTRTQNGTAANPAILSYRHRIGIFLFRTTFDIIHRMMGSVYLYAWTDQRMGTNRDISSVQESTIGIDKDMLTQPDTIPWSQWNGGQMTDVAGMPGTSSSSKLR